MKNNSLIMAFIVIFIASCGNPIEVKNKNLSHDFTISTLSQNLSQALSQKIKLNSKKQNQSCLEYVLSVSCVSRNSESGFDPSCDKADLNETIKNKLEEMIDFLPETQRRVFCQVNQLQFHTGNLKSIAYASMIHNEHQEMLGTLIGIRSDVFFKEENHALFTWKEQLSFGLTDPKDNTTYSNEGPIVKLAVGNTQKPQLYYVFIHEINHLIDFLNQATDIVCTDDFAKCSPAPLSFTAFSWPSEISMNENQREISLMYPLLSQMCFYYCDNFIGRWMMGTIYKALEASQFVTSYSISNPYEDFADFATIHTFHDSGINYDYQILDKKGRVLFDVSKQWNKSHLNEKKMWVDEFFKRKDLKTKI